MIVGDHYTCDCTKYSKPTFEGRRNLLVNSFLGMKADDFDSTNKTQHVTGVQDKFTEYYSNVDTFTTGCVLDSYTRHLFLNWKNKPFMRLAHGVGSCRRKGD